MIVVDSSAMVALLRKEREAADYLHVVQSSQRPRISAANLVETLMVITGTAGLDNWPRVERFLNEAEFEIVPVTWSTAQEAYRAFLRFGKGRHKAALNYGDCFAYALAKQLDMPLLFKGDDFARTDIRPAI